MKTTIRRVKVTVRGCTDFVLDEIVRYVFLLDVILVRMLHASLVLYSVLGSPMRGMPCIYYRGSLKQCFKQ